ncbi:PREDICTED: E3 ubiquitin-protein ligase HECTD3-like, partial [Priapulus caudatus]|uniref:E3 ubiquitin-protein ligase HECTD3-like n=1 Tax=Priapulus caudatus TaxID=37621 RepID=A0ABM1F4B8_PRICU
MKLDENRRVFARLKCLKECIECFSTNSDLPEHFCYVPKELLYRLKPGVQFTGKFLLHSQPCKSSPRACDQLPLPCTPHWTFYASGEEYCNNEGQWIKLLKYSTSGAETDVYSLPDDAWLLLVGCRTGTSGSAEEPLLHVYKPTPKTSIVYRCRPTPVINKWEDVVTHHYSLKRGRCDNAVVAPSCVEAVKRLRHTPASWGVDYDEELVKFLCEHSNSDNEYLGSVRNYVDAIEVSSYCDLDPVKGLTDGDPETCWESDGSQGEHWIRLTIKKGIIIKKLFIAVDAADDNYMPYQVVVMGGELGNTKKLNDVHVDLSFTGDVCILENMSDYYSIVEIKIKECKDSGIDTRIHGIKIKSSPEHDIGQSYDLFCRDNLKRYPKLENADTEMLYRRALALQRFITLMDSVLHYIVPQWQYSVGTFKFTEVVRQILPLSKKRLSLIETFLRDTESSVPSDIPKLYVNRCTAAEHHADPSSDPECKRSIFIQIYEGLKPRQCNEKMLDYRWPPIHDQWWECKFASEGIIDQGGGFRDSLADMAEELCPTDSDVPVSLPFFARAPNQFNVDLNINRDVYVPNIGCTQYLLYEWLGKLMGACLRSRESLVLSLPSFVWKKLVGETVKWSRDYVTVDAAEVKLVDNIETMDQESFTSYFGDEHKFACTACDGSAQEVKHGGADIQLTYENRFEYVKLLKQTKLQEFDKQLEAIRKGILKVIPPAVLDLLTWQELERKICGDPEITVEALRKQTHYEDLDQTDVRVGQLWDALTNFTNADRSRFLRFVTGRRRLPAPMYICADKG